MLIEYLPQCIRTLFEEYAVGAMRPIAYLPSNPAAVGQMPSAWNHGR
jgi:hypothetical protein